MTKIVIAATAGAFAENKDEARRLREEVIEPAIRDGKSITLDFTGVELSTQSFIHALVSKVIRDHKGASLDIIAFKGCNNLIRSLISIVAEYSQTETQVEKR